jgi:cardiolipin synthase
MGINLATRITLLRIVLTPLFLYYLIKGPIDWAVIIFTTAALTDGIDGFIARTWHQKTALGSVLDPLADKLLLTTAFIGLAFRHPHLVFEIIMIVSRDIILVIGALLLFVLGAKFEIKPNISGKITTFCQIIMVLLALGAELFGHIDFLKSRTFELWTYLTVAMTVISGVSYVRKGMMWLHEQTTK